MQLYNDKFERVFRPVLLIAALAIFAAIGVYAYLGFPVTICPSVSSCLGPLFDWFIPFSEPLFQSFVRWFQRISRTEQHPAHHCVDGAFVGSRLELACA